MLLIHQSPTPLSPIELSGDRVTVGRSASSAIHLSHPAVSRHQACFLATDGGWLLVDMESNNGTHVNRQRVGKHRISPGDLISFGTQDDPLTSFVAEAIEAPVDVTLQETHPGTAHLDKRLDEVLALSIQQGEQQEARVKRLEQRVEESEERIEKHLTRFASEVMALRRFDREQRRETRQAVSVLFGLIVVVLSVQMAVSVGGAIRRNPTIGAAISEELNGGEDIGKLIGIIVAWGLARIINADRKGSDGHEHDSNRLEDLPLPPELERTLTLFGSEQLRSGGAAPDPAGGASGENPGDFND